LHGETSFNLWIGAHHPWLIVPIANAPLWMPLSFSVAIAVQREIVVRGFAVGRLLQLTNPVIAVVGCAVLFNIASMYLGFQVWLSEFTLSLLFGLSFALTKRIWPGLIAHAALYALMTAAAYGAHR